MCDCRSSSRRQMSFGGLAGRGDWAAWLPLVFIGAMMFWTVALGLGGWSLMAVTDGLDDAVVPTATAVEPKPGSEAQEAASSERIPVQMEESQEPEDVDDNAGAAPPSTPVWPVVAPTTNLVR
jgi:hypothetical protein